MIEQIVMINGSKIVCTDNNTDIRISVWTDMLMDDFNNNDIFMSNMECG